jgi:16S rRNA (uracil1498-N3)-methyltransferase
MSNRFFVTQPLSQEIVSINDSQVHHLRNVMRAKIGDGVTLFDGMGNEAIAEIISIDRDKIDFRIIETKTISRELNIEIEIAMPLPKADRAKFLIEKLTEIGVNCFTPISTDRSVFSAKAAAAHKLDRYVIEASKQCGRNELMKIGDVIDFDEFIRQPFADSRKFICDPGGQPIINSTVQGFSRFVTIIGPEGGLTESEIAAAQESKWHLVRLGLTILRMETAALVVAVALRHQAMAV